MTTPEEILAKAKKESEKVLRDAGRCASAIVGLPVAPKRVYAQSKEVWINYEVETRKEALELYREFGRNMFEPLAIKRVKGTFLTFCPVDTEDRWHENAEIIAAIEPVLFEHAFKESFLQFWILTSEQVQVRIQIKKDRAIIYDARVRDERGHLVRHGSPEWKERDFPDGRIDRYASGSSDEPGHRVVWFFGATDLDKAFGV